MALGSLAGTATDRADDVRRISGLVHREHCLNDHGILRCSIDQRDEELRLPADRSVHGLHRYAGIRSDARDGGSGVAMLFEQPQRALEDV